MSSERPHSSLLSRLGIIGRQNSMSILAAATGIAGFLGIQTGLHANRLAYIAIGAACGVVSAICADGIVDFPVTRRIVNRLRDHSLT